MDRVSWGIRDTHRVSQNLRISSKKKNTDRNIYGGDTPNVITWIKLNQKLLVTEFSYSIHTKFLQRKKKMEQNQVRYLRTYFYKY